MSVVEVREMAPDGCRFAPGCFDSQIGKSRPLTYNGQTIAAAVLIEATVARDGSFVRFAFEI